MAATVSEATRDALPEAERTPRAYTPVTSYVERYSFVAPRAAGKRILDCGCLGRFGELHRLLRRVTEDVVGIDYDPTIIAQWRAGDPSLRVHPVSVYDLEPLREVEPEPFDVVVFGDLIEHLTDPGTALEQARTVIADDGELIVSTPNAFGLPRSLAYLRRRHHEGWEHVGGYTHQTLESALWRAGFAVRSMHTCLDHPRPETLKFRLGRRFFQRYPHLGGTLLAVAAPRH